MIGVKEMSYNGSIINESSTVSFKVKEDLTGAAFTAVALTDGGVSTATDSTVAIGILTAEHELPIVAGDDVTVQVKDISSWLVGEEVKAGDLLKVGTGGVAMKATSGKFVLAQALENGTKDSAIQVQIIKSGFMPAS